VEEGAGVLLGQFLPGRWNAGFLCFSGDHLNLAG
jgi:hypothetical protein